MPTLCTGALRRYARPAESELRDAKPACRVADFTVGGRIGLIELRRLGAGPLEFEEVRVGRERHRGVPKLAGLLAARNLGQHRPEERHAVDVNGRGADVFADRVHTGVVALAQSLAVVPAGS